MKDNRDHGGPLEASRSDAGWLQNVLYKLVGEAASPQFGDKMVRREKEVSIQVWCKPQGI